MTDRDRPPWRGHLPPRHPLFWDTLLGLGLAAVFVAAAARDSHDGAPPEADRLDVAAALLAVPLLALRRRWPLLLLGLGTLAGVLFAAGDEPRPALVVAVAILAAAVGSEHDRRVAWPAGLAAGTALAAAGLWTSAEGWREPRNLVILATVAMSVAIGDAARSRRAYVAEVEERARRAERDRDEEARRQVVEERLRIARELHDVVAHHIAVINVQAGVAAHLIREQPDEAARALGHVRQAANTVLADLATELGLLRRNEPGDDQAGGTEPAPGLDRLPQLLASMAAAGLIVEHHAGGTPRPLPALVDLAAYRIAQEALTNARKHGSGPARLSVSYTPTAVELEITNPAGARPPGDRGLGLVGMRERAAALGGVLEAGAEPGRFRVRASLPVGGSA
jgi:signal transduction histidine kinase